MGNRTSRTPQKDGRFLAELARCGLVTQAARLAGYTRSRVYAWRREDADFRDRWDDAIAEYVETLESEADRRAVEGILKPVFYLGEPCGAIPQYSDTLLIFRLKALKPEMYRDHYIPKPDDGDHDAQKTGGLASLLEGQPDDHPVR